MHLTAVLCIGMMSQIHIPLNHNYYNQYDCISDHDIGFV